MPVHRRPLAQADLLAIWRYIANDNAGAADRLLDRIDDALRLLDANPHAGRARPELGASIRSFVVGRYILFYRTTDGGIELVRVIHGARDIGAMVFDG